MAREHAHDPAGIAALHDVLATAAREAGATQAILKNATSSFSAVANEVVSVVGGSARGVDRELVQALQEATHQINAAVAALGAVSQSSRAAQ